jgi:hypothetical protein
MLLIQRKKIHVISVIMIISYFIFLWSFRFYF